jgi:hypothetical protein
MKLINFYVIYWRKLEPVPANISNNDAPTGYKLSSVILWTIRYVQQESLDLYSSNARLCQRIVSTNCIVSCSAYILYIDDFKITVVFPSVDILKLFWIRNWKIVDGHVHLFHVAVEKKYIR